MSSPRPGLTHSLAGSPRPFQGALRGRFTAQVLALAAFLAVFLAVAGGSAGQTALEAVPPPGALPPGSGPPPIAGRYVGVTTCASATCHGSTVPRQSTAVLQNEYYTWLQEDGHAQAYNDLFDARSQIIARNLGLGPAHQAQRCLSCHALSVPPAKTGARLEIEDGVTCESCHGPASGWLEGHRSEGWEHGDSVAAGMTDLRGLAGRARLCLSCLLGAPGRSVGHELIAAGHPVLVFELDNFTASMPPHWPAAGGGAPAWALGQAAAFRAGLAQLARRARGETWPELAELRCDSCHHSLAEERWRRPQGRGQAPGQPGWSPARWALLRPLVAEAAPGRLEELDRRVGRLASSVSLLGGSRDEVAQAAEGVAALLGEVEPRLAALTWDEPRARRLLISVAGAGAPEDFDTAAQTLLAVNTLASELLGRRPELAGSSGLVAAIDALDRELKERPAYDADGFGALLQRLEARVRGLSR